MFSFIFSRNVAHTLTYAHFKRHGFLCFNKISIFYRNHEKKKKKLAAKTITIKSYANVTIQVVFMDF